MESIEKKLKGMQKMLHKELICLISVDKNGNLNLLNVDIMKDKQNSMDEMPKPEDYDGYIG